MRSRPRIVVLALCAFGLPLAAAAAPSGPTGASTPGATAVESQMATQMVQMTNNERSARGVGSLQENAYLDAMAQAWSNYAAVNLNGSTIADPTVKWIDAWEAANPCTGIYPTCPTDPDESNGMGPVDSVTAWDSTYVPIGYAVVGLMGSPPHRSSMLTSNYTLAGAGVACVSGFQVENELFSTNPSDPISTKVPTPPTPVVTAASSGTSCQGTPAPLVLNAGVVGMASNPAGTGYWLASSAGQVSAHGAVSSYGDLTGDVLNAPITHIVATADAQGYWLVAADGGTFAFGDAGFFGSMGGQHLNAPVVDLAPTATDKGYWLVASDGGIFAYGDAAFLGSMGGQHLNAPVNGISAAGGGYRLVAADGGIFSFGAPFYGAH